MKRYVGIVNPPFGARSPSLGLQQEQRSCLCRQWRPVVTGFCGCGWEASLVFPSCLVRAHYRPRVTYLSLIHI